MTTHPETEVEIQDVIWVRHRVVICGIEIISNITDEVSPVVSKRVLL